MELHENEKLMELMKVIVQLEDEEQAFRFFSDLCTIKELLDFSDRFDVANMLYHSMTYDAITEKTKMSTATIARVNKALLYGKGGYKEILEKQSK